MMKILRAFFQKYTEEINDNFYHVFFYIGKEGQMKRFVAKRNKRHANIILTKKKKKKTVSL